MRLLTITIVLHFLMSPAHGAQAKFSPEDAFRVRTCEEVDISPDGRWAAFTVATQRQREDPSGEAYSELYIASTKSGLIRPFVTGKVVVSSPRFSPDSKSIAFLTQRGKDENIQVWTIPIDGGEARRLTNSPSEVLYFRWHPKGNTLGYLAKEGQSEKEKLLKEKGYDFIYFEENLKHANIYLQKIGPADQDSQAIQISSNMTVWDFVFSPDGHRLAASASEKNLIDHYYMFRDLYLIDIRSKKHEMLVDLPGKLGNYAFNPQGTHLAYTAAAFQKDHAVSQAYVIPVRGGIARNLTEPGFRGHIEWVGWKSSQTLIYKAGEGTRNTYSTVSAKGGGRKIILDSKKTGMVFDNPSISSKFKKMAFAAESAYLPSELFYWDGRQKPKQLSNLNPWIKQRKLGKQETVRYKARDGTLIEGLLIKPVGYQKGRTYPSILYIHGGPEAHRSDGWLTWYSSPAQVMASKGYVVFVPNYRSSTGYGLDFALEGYKNPAGAEFDDIADGIEYLIRTGLADSKRIGLAGGSYGGYAAAWFASYYTRYVKAVCMFVGISNLISKRGTTDIPYEELYVHSGKPLEKTWELSLKRSPIYWAHQSKTAVLIVGGEDDPRINPSQSIEFYRRLKMNNHPAVRLVQYPGEKHGNRNQPGRIDMLHRQIQWFDWYVKDNRPIDGPMPPLDISDCYGLNVDTTQKPRSLK